MGCYAGRAQRGGQARAARDSRRGRRAASGRAALLLERSGRQRGVQYSQAKPFALVLEVRERARPSPMTGVASEPAEANESGQRADGELFGAAEDEASAAAAAAAAVVKVVVMFEVEAAICSLRGVGRCVGSSSVSQAAWPVALGRCCLRVGSPSKPERSKPEHL